jgi:hypothetical protein
VLLKLTFIISVNRRFKTLNVGVGYPYSAAGGYASEPEPVGGYDSDIGYSAKYATLDRRRIKNKDSDFTTSTMPRSRYIFNFAFLFPIVCFFSFK